jgi:hypothetical protein
MVLIGGPMDTNDGMNGVMLHAASHDIEQIKIMQNAYVISMFPSLKLAWKSLIRSAGVAGRVTNKA